MLHFSRQLDFFVFTAFVTVCMQLTVTAAQRHHRTTGSSTTGTSWLGPELSIVRRVYGDCQDKNDFLECLKQKALTAINRAIEQDSVKITDGLVLEKQNHTEKESILGAITDVRSLSGLSAIDRALLTKADLFARTHALKIDMSEGRGHDDGGHGGGGGHGHGHGHGHKKKDKGGGHIKYVIAALLTAMGIAGPIGLKALAAIAGKALVISKVALTIAGIIALKKLFSHDHHEETSFQVHAGDHNR